MSAPVAKPPTPQGIVALLRKAGFERAVTIRQIPRRRPAEHTAGYHVRKRAGHADEVVVDWWPSTCRVAPYCRVDIDGQVAEAIEMQQRYAVAIRTAGWGVEVTRLNVRVYAPSGADR